MVPSVNGSDAVFVAARIAGGGCGADKSAGLYLHLNMKDKKFIMAYDTSKLHDPKRWETLSRAK